MLEGDSKDNERKGFIEEIYKKRLTFPINNRENLQKLFNDFAEKISEKEGKEYSFDNYFEHWTNIGFPMTQAMITENDYCKLTQKFERIKNKSEIDKWREKDFEDFSLIMKKFVASSDEIDKQKLIQKIKALYQSWDGNVLEIDECDYKRNRKFINLLYAYSENREQFQYYYTAEARNDYEDILCQQITLKKEDNSKYYQKVQIEEKDISLKSKLSYSINCINGKQLPIQRKDVEFIKLKEEDGYFIEQTACNGIKEGDRFSIIATEQFFQNHIDELENVTDDNIEKLYKLEGTNLFLLHNIYAPPGKYDNNFVAFNSKDKIRFKKGLKSGNGNNSWIKGAEPIIEINNMSSVKIDGIREKNLKEIDIRKREEYKSIGKHEIKLDKSDETRAYSIVEFKDMIKTEGFKTIYHIITDFQIKRDETNIQNQPMIIGGYISNINLSPNDDISSTKIIKSKKLLYILNILKMHNNKQEYKIPNKMKLKIEDIANNCDETTALELYDYIEKNEYIDNYIYIYLKQIGRMAYEQAK